ncbi:hypothetical protein ANN_04354 [Periplaneta americana]|uniref:DUF4817 domain-containing protein n=1 Tax=Periplaneta americana TaxID=6978 RepID=A0ABQ8TA57_PERAM|nr:hypothetical protein ANN_04354 [Periplaneta americana]
MAGICESGNESPGSLKIPNNEKPEDSAGPHYGQCRTPRRNKSARCNKLPKRMTILMMHDGTTLDEAVSFWLAAPSTREYADILFIYGFCHRNALAAVEYRRRFPNRRVPSRCVFSRAYRMLSETEVRRRCSFFTSGIFSRAKTDHAMFAVFLGKDLSFSSLSDTSQPK